jgi:hypothetical protein
VVHTCALDDTLVEGYPFPDDGAPFGWRVEHIEPIYLLEQDRRRRVLTFVKRDSRASKFAAHAKVQFSWSQAEGCRRIAFGRRSGRASTCPFALGVGNQRTRPE